MSQSDYYLGLIVLAIVNLIAAPFITRKMTNAADKEDLQDLQGQLENFKGEIAKNQAKVVSDLDIIKDKKTKHYTQTQQAIIAFYTDYLNWEYRAVIFIAEGFNLLDSKKMMSLFLETEEFKQKINITRAILSIMLSDADFEKAVLKITQETIEITIILGNFIKAQQQILSDKTFSEEEKASVSRLSQDDLIKLNEKSGGTIELLIQLKGKMTNEFHLRRNIQLESIVVFKHKSKEFLH